ncbi:MAG: redox-sensing transcriptional repressor Rex [Oscillospiraceae bacterium]
MQKSNISNSVIRRLPRYYRFLGELLNQGITKISSRELSEKMMLTASQIRQDLNCFGGFGQQGYGYNVAELRSEIAHILGLDRIENAVLVGAGNLGRAITMHIDFERYGYRLTGIFDSNPAMENVEITGLAIKHTDRLSEFCTEYHPTMAILCIPRSGVQDTVQQLYELGVKAFWNFSHYDIHMNFPGVQVENVHLTDSLMTLSYIAKNAEIEESDNSCE